MLTSLPSLPTSAVSRRVVDFLASHTLLILALFLYSLGCWHTFPQRHLILPCQHEVLTLNTFAPIMVGETITMSAHVAHVTVSIMPLWVIDCQGSHD